MNGINVEALCLTHFYRKAGQGEGAEPHHYMTNSYIGLQKAQNKCI